MANGTCSIPECESGVLARRWCSAHYQRWWTYGDPLGKPAPRPPLGCAVEGCDREHTALGYCNKHYQRFKRYGSTEDRPRLRSACVIDGCGKPAIARGWCARHYTRWSKYGDPLAESRIPKRGQCSIDGCPRRYRGHGLCELHLRRWRKGTPMDAPVRGEVIQICAEPGCDKPNSALGWCKKHYHEFRTKPRYPVYNQRQRQRYAQETPAQKAERAVRRHEQYAANRETIRARELARYKERYPIDPAPWRAAKSRRKMRGQARMTREDIQISVDYRRLIRYNPCFYCGAPTTAHTDHYFPLAKGGTDHWWNLVRACSSCNLSKHAHCGTWFLLRTASGPGLAAAVA